MRDIYFPRKKILAISNMPEWFNLLQLKYTNKKKDLSEKLESLLDQQEVKYNMKVTWKPLKDTTYSAAFEFLRIPTRKLHDCFNTKTMPINAKYIILIYCTLMIKTSQNANYCNLQLYFFLNNWRELGSQLSSRTTRSLLLKMLLKAFRIHYNSI